jgi:FtsZ-interacting cell division protein ZipA
MRQSDLNGQLVIAVVAQQGFCIGRLKQWHRLGQAAEI